MTFVHPNPSGFAFLLHHRFDEVEDTSALLKLLTLVIGALRPRIEIPDSLKQVQRLGIFFSGLISNLSFLSFECL